MFSGVQPLAVWPRSLTAYARIVRGRSRTPARAVTCAQAARHRRGCRGRCRWWSWWPSRLLRAPSSIRLGPYWARDSRSPPKYGFDLRLLWCAILGLNQLAFGCGIGCASVGLCALTLSISRTVTLLHEMRHQAPARRTPTPRSWVARMTKRLAPTGARPPPVERMLFSVEFRFVGISLRFSLGYRPRPRSPTSGSRRLSAPVSPAIPNRSTRTFACARLCRGDARHLTDAATRRFRGVLIVAAAWQRSNRLVSCDSVSFT